jgi:adenylylsulfate kinase
MKVTLWLTGLSASGKTTVAEALSAELNKHAIKHMVIDGDVLRRGLCADLGFSREDRRENVRRAAEYCRWVNQQGSIAIAALISPYKSDREMARQIIGPSSFCEIWLDTPFDICVARDPKGLYSKAYSGEIDNFTGVSDPYEAPTNPSLRLQTHLASIEESVAKMTSLVFKE